MMYCAAFFFFVLSLPVWSSQKTTVHSISHFFRFESGLTSSQPECAFPASLSHNGRSLANTFLLSPGLKLPTSGICSQQSISSSQIARMKIQKNLFYLCCGYDNPSDYHKIMCVVSVPF